jgi:FdrA protein
MQVSRAVGDEPGVERALVAMATELNLELLAGMGFDPPGGATPNDLVVAIAAADPEALDRARERLEAELSQASGPARGAGTAPGGGGPGAAPPPRTVGSAVRRSGAALALVSTPGRNAYVDAADALEAGASVVLFSDNVPVAQEIELKEEAARRGLLVMGPDCGTVVIGGIGLGFANVVRPGPVGLVAASGTGAQQVMCLLDAAGVGISHCLGVGGRDLSEDVGARSTLTALDVLDADPATELIMVVSKPPAARVADAVRAQAARLSTPVAFALVGAWQPDLTAAVEAALTRLGRRRWPPWSAWLPGADRQRDTRQGAEAPAQRGYLRGLFSGGTLCGEAMVIAAQALGPIASNIPLQPAWALPDDLRARGHAMIDFGDDRLTRGRPHPMIDSGLRLERLAEEAADPRCAVVLLDVVLGHGAHPDPAAELAPAIAAARNRDGGELRVVVSLCGTAGDPQGLDRQARALRDAGAAVFLSNAAAARHAVVQLR